MALGSENQFYLQQQMLPTRGIYQQHQRPIAPAPTAMTMRSFGIPYMKPAKSCAGTTLESNNPSVVRRNARERNRVKQVNNGFSNLRQHIPVAIIADLSNGRRGIGPGASKKLSKVDTLRMAVEYIRRLQRVIDEVDGSDTSSVSSFNSCSSSISSSPPPANQAELNCGAFYHQSNETFYGINYAGSLETSSYQQQHATLISPAGSTSSSVSSSNSYYEHTPPAHSSTFNGNYSTGPLKFEQNMEDYTKMSNEEDEILDYISLWQEDL